MHFQSRSGGSEKGNSSAVTSLHIDNFISEEKMDTSIAIQILPSVLEDEEICRIVDEVIAYIKSTGYHCVAPLKPQ